VMWMSPCETASKVGTASVIAFDYNIYIRRFRRAAGGGSLC
jgi:hypothetical protein